MNAPREPSARRAVRPGRRPAWQRVLLVAIGLVAVYALIGFLLAPLIVRSQLEKRLSAQLDRPVRVEKVRLNPFALAATITGLAITERDGAPLAGWTRLHVNFDSFSLFKREWGFQEITLEGLRARAVIAPDGRLNFADLAPAPDAKPKEPTEPGRPLRVDQLTVTDARGEFVDRSQPQEFASTLGPVTFTLTGFRTVGDPQSPYDFSAVSEAGEQVTWRGTLSVAPLRSEGEIRFEKLALKKYAPYYATRVRGDVVDGLLSLSAHYRVDFSSGARVLALTEGQLTLVNLAVGERGAPAGAAPAIRLPSTRVEGATVDLVAGRYAVARAVVEGGELQVRREADNTLNLARLFSPETSAASASPAAPVTPATAPSAAPAGPPATPAGAPQTVAGAKPDVRVAEISIQGLAVNFEDRAVADASPQRITSLDLTVRDVSLDPQGKPWPTQLAVALAPAGTLKIDGAVAPLEGSAELAVQAGAVPLAAASPYVQHARGWRVTDGAFSADGRLKITREAQHFQGNALVNGLAVQTANAEPLAGWSALELRGITFNSAPLEVVVDEVALTEPAGRLVLLETGGTNFSGPTPASPATPTGASPQTPPAPPGEAAEPPAAADGAPAAPALRWRVGALVVNKAGFEFEDRAVSPAMKTGVTDFSGRIGGLSSDPATHADVNLQGRVGGTGHVALQGKLNAGALAAGDAVPASAAAGEPGGPPRAAAAPTDLSIDLKNVPMQPFGAYVAKFAGYELARGGLTLDSSVRLTGEQLESANALTLADFTLGERVESPDAVKAPVTLAVALLKDRRGNIVLNLPVQGNLRDPQFSVGPVVGQVLRNLITKAATSPFALLGAAFGGRGEELSYQQFAPGSTQPAPGEAEKLDTLRRALADRPALRVEIIGSYDPGADVAALRIQRLDAELRERVAALAQAGVAGDAAGGAIGGKAAGAGAAPAREPPASAVSVEQRALQALFVERFAPAGNSPPGPASPADSTAVARAGGERVNPSTPPPAEAADAERRPNVVVRLWHWVEDKFRPGPEQPGLAASTDAPTGGGAPAFPSPEEMRALLAERLEIAPADLLRLAEARAETVRRALAADGAVEAERLQVVAPAAEGKGARVSFQLK